MAAIVRRSAPKSVAAGDAVMTGAGAWTAGADQAIAAANLAAQGMSNPVAGSTRITGDNMAVMTHFLAHGTLLGLGQRTQCDQHSENTE
jgi:hypothetical protein